MGICPTPHINAHPGDFAHTVLMPGDAAQKPIRRRELSHRRAFSE